MYMIFKYVSPISLAVVPLLPRKFTSYEDARRAARRWIRNTRRGSWLPLRSLMRTTNPSLQDFDLTVRKVGLHVGDLRYLV